METSSLRRTSSRQRIRDVAAACFYRHGYHATTMREIATEVGMKAGSLYNHYASKEDILFEIASETMVELLAGAREAVAEPRGPEAKLRDLVRRHVEYHAANRTQAKVADDQLHALSEPRRQQVIDVRDEYEQLVKSVVKEGRDTAGWPVADVPIITFAILTMSTGVGTWFREGGRATPQRVGTIYADFVMNALTNTSDVLLQDDTPAATRPVGKSIP